MCPSAVLKSSHGATPATKQCWLVRGRQQDFARWWCAKCRHWHINGWSRDNDGRRLAPCTGQIRIVPLGWADAALVARIEDDLAPPGVADPGICLTPEIFRHQILVELAILLNEIRAQDGMLGSTLEKWVRLAVRVNVWRHLHGLTLGAVRENDVSAICELVERAGKGIGHAIQTLFPHLPVDGLPGSANGIATPATKDWAREIRLTGVIVTPQLARRRAHRELTAAIANFETAESSDEFCNAIGYALEMEIQVLKSWHALDAKLHGNVDRAYIWEVVSTVRWDHKSVEDAVTLLMLSIAKT